MFRDPDSGPPWVPRADVLKTDAGDVVIKVELAGLLRGDIELSIEGQGIRITGHRHDADCTKARNQYVTPGIQWGWFDLLVDVPTICDLSQAKATYQNGLLRVVIPKTTVQKPN